MAYLIKQEEEEEIGKMQEIGKIVRAGGEEEEIDKETKERKGYKERVTMEGIGLLSSRIYNPNYEREIPNSSNRSCSSSDTEREQELITEKKRRGRKNIK